jgi:hypothetical protein
MGHEPMSSDPWALDRPRIEGLVASCADYLGRITRSLQRGTDAHYVTDKAHQLRSAAALLVDACHEGTLDARRCGTDVEQTDDEGEAWVEECALPRGHRGPHSPRRPATPLERAAKEAHELAEQASHVADLLAWCTGPGGCDQADVDELERGLRTVGRSLESARSAVAALRARDTEDEASEDVR